MKCPICNNKNFQLLKKVEKYKPLILSFDGKKPRFDNIVSLAVNSCQKCSHIFIKTDFEELDSFYKDSAPRGMLSLNLSDRDLMAKNIIDDLIDRFELKSLCEIGGGCGGFTANLCKEREFDNIVLVDPILENNREVKKVIENVKRLRLYSNLHFEKENNMVDLVVMRQVLEHIKEPKMFLKQSFELLKTDGFSYIEVPNVLYTLEKKQGFDLCFEHLQYFSPDNLKYLLTNMGMDIISWGFTKDKHDMYVVCKKNSKRTVVKNEFNKDDVKTTEKVLLEFPRFGGEWIAYGLNSNLESILNFTESTIPEFIIDDSVAYEGAVFFGEKKIHCTNS